MGKARPSSLQVVCVLNRDLRRVIRNARPAAQRVHPLILQPSVALSAVVAVVLVLIGGLVVLVLVLAVVLVLGLILVALILALVVVLVLHFLSPRA